MRERQVTKLREVLAEAMLEFDPSDSYHKGTEYDDRSYYAAIDRCVRLVRGEIVDWLDKGA